MAPFKPLDPFPDIVWVRDVGVVVVYDSVAPESTVTVLLALPNPALLPQESIPAETVTDLPAPPKVFMPLRMSVSAPDFVILSEPAKTQETVAAVIALSVEPAPLLLSVIVEAPLTTQAEPERPLSEKTKPPIVPVQVPPIVLVTVRVAVILFVKLAVKPAPLAMTEPDQLAAVDHVLETSVIHVPDAMAPPQVN